MLTRVGVLNPLAIKSTIGMHRRRRSSTLPLCDPGWVVLLVVVEDGDQSRLDDKESIRRLSRGAQFVRLLVICPSERLRHA